MQTNAPAGGEWVDQFNRAVVYGQINGNNLSPDKIGAPSVVTRQYGQTITLFNNTDDQIITSFAFPGGFFSEASFERF